MNLYLIFYTKKKKKSFEMNLVEFSCVFLESGIGLVGFGSFLCWVGKDYQYIWGTSLIAIGVGFWFDC